MQVTYDPSNAFAQANQAARPNWSAVFAVAFCVACLITVEFLPVSLLTPMAQDLGISEGVAGQSVTTTAFVAMFASLFITSIIRNTDRRYVVILFSVLLTLSCLLVSFANSFSLLLLGRACLGWRWAASGRCRRRSPCGWCRCAWCPKRYRLFSARYR
jgi:DHA1 family purine ribonucleoside efflux pump-like MFS transporter